MKQYIAIIWLLFVFWAISMSVFAHFKGYDSGGLDGLIAGIALLSTIRMLEESK